MARRIVYPLLCLVGLAAGCSLFLGETYHPRRTLPGSMTVIYVYSGDIDARQEVVIDREPHTPAATHSVRMIKDGYFQYLMPAGPVRILTPAGDEPFCISLDALPGFQYWVRISGPNAKEQRVEVVVPETGQKEISAHREISTARFRDARGAYEVDCPENAASGTRVVR
jgi:hypothetical protein